jgi:sodium-dependent phosphate cotransporter
MQDATQPDPPQVPAPLGRVQTVLRVLLILLLVYAFLLSVQMMGGGLQQAAQDGRNEETIRGFIESFSRSPVVALFIGVIVTAVFQSSSFTTSLVVGLVAARTLTVAQAIPLVMGANVGTTVTNTLVSLGHLSRRDEFRRAFAGAVVHDIFNLLTVAVLFPIEVAFHPLEWAAARLSPTAGVVEGQKFPGLLDYICDPVIDAFIGFNRLVGMGNTASGIVVTIVAAALLFLSLVYTVKVLKRLVLVRVERFFDRVLFRNALMSFLVGLVLTFIVQSSSVATSMIVPLLGAGLLSLPQVFPYTVGSNIGTTIKMMLVALATGQPACVQIAWVHLLFNCAGGAIFMPLKFVPIGIATYLGRKVEKNRAYAIVHLAFVFIIIPAVAIAAGHLISMALGGS